MLFRSQPIAFFSKALRDAPLKYNIMEKQAFALVKALKDNYPLPKMDHILQRVVGSKRISLLDGYSGYNQILVHPADQLKTAFTTPWGTFMYVTMHFGLMNAGATFQRAIDIAFSEELGFFIIIYLDDVTVF